MKSKTLTPADAAARVLSPYLSGQSLYSEVLDVLGGDDFLAMEDAVSGDTLTDANKTMAGNESRFGARVELVGER